MKKALPKLEHQLREPQILRNKEANKIENEGFQDQGKRNHRTVVVQQPRAALVQVRVAQRLLEKSFQEGEIGRIPDVFECTDTCTTRGELGVE